MFSHVGSTRAFNQNFLTFNSLNTFILKGDAAQGMELTFATLMSRAEDEPDALYGLAARAVQISPEGSRIVSSCGRTSNSTTAARSRHTMLPSRWRCSRRRGIHRAAAAS